VSEGRQNGLKAQNNNRNPTAEQRKKTPKTPQRSKQTSKQEFFRSP
jgi:hypothetical protein